MANLVCTTSGHRLVQPYPGSKYIKYSTLLCTIAAREPPGNRQDILAALEDAVSFGYIAAGLTIAEFAVPEEYADPDLGLDGPICIPATKVFVHDGRKQSRARATALVRTLPTFAQHAHRIRISSSAHFPNALSAHEVTISASLLPPKPLSSQVSGYLDFRPITP